MTSTRNLALDNVQINSDFADDSVSPTRLHADSWDSPSSAITEEDWRRQQQSVSLADGDNFISRVDHVVRRNVRDMIAEVLSPDGDPANVLEVLELCRTQCQETGVPFAPLLDEPLDVFGAPPLVVEILRCQLLDDDSLPPVLSYLLIHSNDKTMALNIRQASFLRGDNAIFQRLRVNIASEFLPTGAMPIFEADVHEDLEQHSFTTQIEIGDFEDGLHSMQSRLQLRSTEKSPVHPTGVVEFIAAARMWEFLIGANSLALKLVRGDPIEVDARCIALALEPHELLFPRAVLYPLNAGGQHVVSLQPCFLGSDPSSFTDIASLDTGELIIQLHVQLRTAPGPSVPSELPDGDWDTLISQKETSELEHEPGWIKASWSGKDEDL